MSTWPAVGLPARKLHSPYRNREYHTIRWLGRPRPWIKGKCVLYIFQFRVYNIVYIYKNSMLVGVCAKLPPPAASKSVWYVQFSICRSVQMTEEEKGNRKEPKGRRHPRVCEAFRHLQLQFRGRFPKSYNTVPGNPSWKRPGYWLEWWIS